MRAELDVAVGGASPKRLQSQVNAGVGAEMQAGAGFDLKPLVGAQFPVVAVHPRTTDGSEGGGVMQLAEAVSSPEAARVVNHKETLELEMSRDQVIEGLVAPEVASRGSTQRSCT